jgi:hypothetical protein
MECAGARLLVRREGTPLLFFLLFFGKANARSSSKSGFPFGNDNKKTNGKAKEIRLGGDHQWLPEFDAVAFGVGDPGEAAIVFVLALGIDGYAVGG